MSHHLSKCINFRLPGNESLNITVEIRHFVLLGNKTQHYVYISKQKKKKKKKEHKRQLEFTHDWDLLLIAADDVQIRGVLSLGCTKSVFFVTMLSEQWTLLFLAGMATVAVRQWFTEVKSQGKFSPDEAHSFSHTCTHTHHSQKFTTARLGMGTAVVNYITMNIP